jgi:hypothetical protein
VTIGAALALVVDVLMLSAGHFGLTREAGLLGTFYDAQGHAFLHGRLDVDPATVAIEGFRVGGRTYIYFGPVPAILRLPVLAVTQDLDGRLTQLSMLLGLVVLLLAGARLHWRIRELVRPGAAVGRADLVAATLFQLALGAGSVVLFLTSWLSVYNETELWGAAFTLAAVDAVVGVILEPTGRRIGWAGVLTLLAVQTRVSVGLGPVIALLVLAVAVGADRIGGAWARRVAGFGPTVAPERRGRTVALLVAAALVPVISYAAINEAKFGQAFGIPFDRQVNTRLSPVQQETLRRNGGGLFGAKFVPTTVLQAARPDAIGWARGFPFLSLPSWHPKVIGDVMFEKLQRSLSAPTSMLLFCILGLVGVVVVATRRALHPLAGVVVGTAAGFVPALAIAFVTTRYLTDLLPCLALTSLVGLQALLGTSSAPRRRALLSLVALGALLGVVVNGSVGLLVQRLIGSATEADRASFVRAQDRVDRLLGRDPTGIRAGTALPAVSSGRPGDLFVVGDCAALYVLDQDDDWQPVERTERGGLHRLRVRFPVSTQGATEALLTIGSGPRRVVVTTRGAAGRFVVAVRVGDTTMGTSQPIAMPTDRPVTVTLSFDNTYRASFAGLSVDGRRVVTVAAPFVADAPTRIGADPDAAGLRAFSGSVRRVPTDAPVCRRVARRAGVLSGTARPTG